MGKNIDFAPMFKSKQILLNYYIMTKHRNACYHTDMHIPEKNTNVTKLTIIEIIFSELSKAYFVF